MNPVQHYLLTLCIVVISVQSSIAQSPLDDTKPTLGLQLVDTKDAIEIWKENKLPARSAPKKGLMIATVVVGSEGHNAGIKQFDLLEKVNGASVRTADRVNELLEGKKPGDTIELQIRRMNNGAWFPIKGEMKCGTQRTAAYAQMDVSGSEVNQSFQLKHSWFSGRKDYIAPIVFLSNGSASLMIELSTDSSEALLPKELTARAGANSSSLSLGLLKSDSDIYSGDGEARVHETVRVKCEADFEKLLRAGQQIKLRVDGAKKYREFSLSELDLAALRVSLAVYDDIVATKNQDLTLGGRVKR